MDDHEHEIVTHLYHVKVPYHLKPQEIEFEPGETSDALPDLLEELALKYTVEETQRVMRSVTLLMEKYPHRKLTDAIVTAMVWERG